MAHIFIINIFFLFSLSLNATTINQVFGSSDDTSNSPPGTKAEAVFGNYSKSPVKAAEPAKETNKEEVGGETKESAKEETKAETKEETKEEPKEAATGSSHHRAAAVFGRSSSEGSAESSGSGGSRLYLAPEEVLVLMRLTKHRGKEGRRKKDVAEGTKPRNTRIRVQHLIICGRSTVEG